MAKNFLVYCLLIVAVSIVRAQNPRELQLLISKSKPDTNQVKLLQQLGSYYIDKPGEFKNDLDSAMNNFNAALKLSRKCNFKKGELKTLMLIGGCYLEAGNFEQAKSYYVKIINEYHSTGDKLNEALAWFDFGDGINYGGSPHRGDGVIYFKHAYDLFKQIPGKQIDALNACKAMADIHMNQEKYQLAETELLEVLKQFERIHYPKLYKTYYLLSALYGNTGNFEKRLFYAIECVKSVEMDTTAGLDEKGLYYSVLGVAYYALKDYDQCVIFETKSLEISKHFNFDGFYPTVTGITYALAASRGAGAALAFLHKQEAIHAPQTDYEKEAVIRLELRYNLDLKRYNEAGKIAAASVNTYSERLQKAVHENNYTLFKDHVTLLSLITRYYLETNQNRNAIILLNKLLSLPLQKLSADPRVTLYSLQYKIDSLQGNYLASLRTHEKMALLKDSIAYYEKNEQVAKMNARFKTFQKEQAIQLLNKKNSDQQTRLQKAGIRQDYMTGIGVLLCIIAGLTFYGLRNKQRSNKKLKTQQQEINQINQSLRHTVAEKDSLLKEKDNLLIEKDWLLKEVNHRVKNNLHMVISLLESQAIYLENDALKAMQSSKHRIFSMSLIHQKFYQSADVKTIDMSVCLPELVNYLRDSFDAGKYIHFNLEIDPVQLSVSQAIPLALVLNEAITNSVKYAFPGNRLGEISIKMRKTCENIELIIRDNGVGMAKATEDTDLDSLGLKLMKGLIEEISGEIHFENNNGTIITITFRTDVLVEKDLFLN